MKPIGRPGAVFVSFSGDTASSFIAEMRSKLVGPDEEDEDEKRVPGMTLADFFPVVSKLHSVLCVD